MADALTRLGRSKFIPFIKVDNEWKRVDKSTVGDLELGEVTEDYDYIDNDDTITEVTGNQPTISLEIANIDGNPVYDFMEKMIVDAPTGEDAKVDFLYCFGGSEKYAWSGKASVTEKALSPTDQKISFTLNVLEKTIGTYTITDGEPTFTPNTALKVTPNALTIIKGENGTATISGGTAPYTVATETANIEASIGLDGVTVTVTTNNQSASSDTATITDANEDEVEIAITVVDE